MSLIRKNPVVVLFGALLLALSGYCLHVAAEGVPSSQPLWYAGTVSDNAGAPLTGSHQVAVRLFNAASGSTALCLSGPTPVPFERGRFRIELSAACVDIIRKTSDLFVEVSVDDESKPFPRSKIGAVPYALEAAHAVTASEAVGGLKQALENIPKITAWAPFKPDVFVDKTQITVQDGDVSGRYRRVGDTVEAQYSLNTSAIGANAGLVSFALPAGLSADQDKLIDYASVGSGIVYAVNGPGNGSATWAAHTEISHITSRIQVVFNSVQGGGAALASDAPFALATGGSTHFNVSVPVKGWTLSTP